MVIETTLDCRSGRREQAWGGVTARQEACSRRPGASRQGPHPGLCRRGRSIWKPVRPRHAAAARRAPIQAFVYSRRWRPAARRRTVVDEPIRSATGSGNYTGALGYHLQRRWRVGSTPWPRLAHEVGTSRVADTAIAGGSAQDPDRSSIGPGRVEVSPWNARPMPVRQSASRQGYGIEAHRLSQVVYDQAESGCARCRIPSVSRHWRRGIAWAISRGLTSTAPGHGRIV